MPALVLRPPIVRDVVRARGVELRRVEVERQQHAHGWIGRIRGVGLAEGGTWLGEAAHAAVAAEIVVERTVLLDENDHVLDVGEAAAGRYAGEHTRERVACTGGRHSRRGRRGSRLGHLAPPYPADR